MGILNRLFGKGDSPPQDDGPFMDHPTGEFDTAFQAICSAMQRLDQTDMGDRWIDFCAQGQGAGPELIHFESVLFNGRTFDLSGQTVALKPIPDSAGLTHAGVKFETDPGGKITLPDATPGQLARFLDALFKKHFGIKAFEDEGDYAVGAEWQYERQLQGLHSNILQAGIHTRLGLLGMSFRVRCIMPQAVKIAGGAPTKSKCHNVAADPRPAIMSLAKCETTERKLMDFRQHIPFGRTGLKVSRIGLASGYGVPAAAIEKAFHEYGINYFYLSFLQPGKMVQAIRNLAPKHRDELCIVLAKPVLGGFFLQSFVERWLKKLKIEAVDLMVLASRRKPPNEKLIERVHRLKESGKVVFVGMSSHKRPLFGRIARGEVKAPVDFFQIRYNAVHSGAEEDIFPHLPQENRPGIVVFTATCWRKLLKPRLMPPGEGPVQPGECYRYVLSQPDVDVCLSGPSTAEQMEDNLKALDAGPLNEEEMARMRRIGEHIYQKS